MTHGREMKKFLTTQEVADLLQVSPRSLENQHWKGGGPPYHKFGRLVRYERESLDDWLASKFRRSTSDSGG